MNINQEEAKKLAEEIYEQLLAIPSRLMKHKCGNPISKETAVANIYLTLLKEDEKDMFTKACIRESGHEGPCNGLPREDCLKNISL
jgi:hypothetical protein